MERPAERMLNTSPTVLIVGASLAGLACAKRLAECGISFQLLEAGDAVGGSHRTDSVDGFRLDRRFPLFFPAFPEARRVLDFDVLQLQPYARALEVRFDGRFHRIADPRCEPLAFLRSLTNPIGSIRDKLRLVHFFESIARGRAEQQIAREERLTLDLVRWNGGFSAAMIERFFRPLGGWLLHDRILATSSRLFRFLARMMIKGPVTVPALGLQAVADQMAMQLPKGCIRSHTEVASVNHREVALLMGESLKTRAVVIAQPPPSGRMCAIVHYGADRPPTDERIVRLDGAGNGPVNHVMELPQSYAPPQNSLIAAGIVDVPTEDDTELDRLIRVQMSDWFGATSSSWKLLRIHRYTVPEQTAGILDPWQRPVRVHPGLYVCGEHIDQATIDGELTSGFRAAQAVLEDLHEKRT